MDVKNELEKRANSSQTGQVRLSKSMTIVDMVKALEPEIRRALPAVITPERFTRMALSAINNTPELADCTPMSFIAALMNAAQLGMEPNTPLGQAYLIPYRNKGTLECQFQLGYKGLIDLAYRTGQIQIIQAQAVREYDYFEYQYGLDSSLVHKPGHEERGQITFIYGLFKLSNGGFGFEVSNKAEMDAFAARYSKSFGSKYSPWTEDFESMAKKTVIKRALKYAPISSDFQKALSLDETVKSGLSVDMSEIRNDCLSAETAQEAA
ncbi:recombinase RecT [Enterocloster sp.]|jgi:recombination protein RecT|uniref:recombinase RecT n=1 Tax=Enterocloster TaxID=2719313 RepID=UPI00257F80D3|nr:recombinase RecT [Enterocloster sp.]MBS5405957.1 recombinase RecT [Enterocloster sp.]